MQLWFATVLRDGISISASGGFATFKDIASNAVKQLMAKAGSSQDSNKAAADIIKGFDEVQAYPDVLPGLQAIHNAGIKASTVIYVTYQGWISKSHNRLSQTALKALIRFKHTQMSFRGLQATSVQASRSAHQSNLHGSNPA